MTGMIGMNSPVTTAPGAAPTFEDVARCLSCGAPLRGQQTCMNCKRGHAAHDGIFDAIGPLSGRNRIVAAFYDGPGWVKFRPWEQGFLMVQGGVRRARMEILRHLIARTRSPAIGLEVGIGSGENLRFLPEDWTVFGVDIARTQLEACLRRHPNQSGRLVWAEAESLPFDDATFDCSWTVGGFNYFNDHESALRELRRVTKPGGVVVVADENPRLHRTGLGHLIGVPSLDAWWLERLGLDREFVKMVLEFDLDLAQVTSKMWPRSARHRIWHGLGYCLVDPAIL
jgi:ubiquinone/menaquinone biosynthesis C-methylase UbiE